MMKKDYFFRGFLFLIVLSIQFFSLDVALGQQYCTDPYYSVDCFDPGYPNDPAYGWCCTLDYPICGSNYLECYSGSPATTSTIYPSTTTIPGVVTTTIPGTATTTIPGVVTTTIPGTVTTTTVPSGNVGDFIVGINLNTQDVQLKESSGILPGTSPQKTTPLLLREDGRAIPLWYDANPPVDLELLKQSKALLKKRDAVAPAEKIQFQLGQQKNFWVKDSNDTAWRQVAATSVREGQHGIIYVDDTITVPDDSLDEYNAEFDKMYQILADNIGEYIDRDGDNKVAILFYNFNDGGNINMFMAGYFWQKDYYADAVASQQGIRSNEMDIIYIRGNVPTGWEQVGTDFYETTLTTLIHEYQHMVNFCITVWSQQDNTNVSASAVWINEMMSMSSETMYFKEKLRENPSYTNSEMEGDGYMATRLLYYNRDPKNSIRNGHGLIYWDSNGDVLSNYSLAYLFGQYLAIHSSNGQGIFKDILNYMVANKVYDTRAVTAAASQKISGITSWEDLLKSFVIANMACQSSGLFGYKGGFALTPHGPTLNSAQLNAGGAVYRAVSGEVSAPAGAGRDVKFFDANGTALQGGNTCPSSQLLGEHSQENNILRTLRDTILRGSAKGETLVDLYYRHAPELTAILLRNQEVRIQTLKVLFDILPAINAVLQGDGLNITRDMEEDIYALCDSMSREAGFELQDVIENLKVEFAGGTLLHELGIDSAVH